ncbi:hypothetical protein B296_00059139 [Ensete ventricosum]|uniref:Uncharacterized protein n=1 Tax=Ensete ventricosum TaxID=4639 RepID=A0A426WX38_ENSVE|nr:hypothetical protein B296_00059139 [Ensete ventricosum]
MLHPSVTQEWVDEGELLREQTKNRRWRRPYDVLAEATHGEVVVRRVGLLQCSHSLKGSSASQRTRPRELLGKHRGVEAGGRKGRGSDDEFSGAQLPKSKMSVRKEIDSEECHSTAEADLPITRKGRGCETMDSRAMGLVALWYHRGGTFVESSIPCSHGARALVVKVVEEVKNAEANSKYQDRVEGQWPRNFIRLVSMGLSSR